MTREEAIRWLEDIHRRFNPTGENLENEGGDVHLQALGMAIDALEGKDTNVPTKDCISRQDIKYHVQLEAMGNGQYEKVEVAYKDDIESLPSATCDDCIWHTCNYNKVDWDGEDGEA